jgi:hypothetical protein
MITKKFAFVLFSAVFCLCGNMFAMEVDQAYFTETEEQQLIAAFREAQTQNNLAPISQLIENFPIIYLDNSVVTVFDMMTRQGKDFWGLCDQYLTTDLIKELVSQYDTNQYGATRLIELEIDVDGLEQELNSTEIPELAITVQESLDRLSIARMLGSTISALTYW